MKRHWVLALAVVVALPRIGQAQGDPIWGPVFRVTPFIGISPGITQSGEAFVFTNNNAITVHPYDLEYSSSIPIGLNLEARVWNRFGLIVAGAFVQRPDARLVDFEDEIIYEIDGTNLWLAKAALAIHLRENEPDMQLRRLNASVFVGPAFIRDDPKVEVFTPPLARGVINHWGVNLGAEAELPLANNRLAFVAALEDWIIFWDDPLYRDRIEPYFQASNPAVNAVTLESDKTNLWILRVGLSFRF